MRGYDTRMGWSPLHGIGRYRSGVGQSVCDYTCRIQLGGMDGKVGLRVAGCSTLKSKSNAIVWHSPIAGNCESKRLCVRIGLDKKWVLV